MKINFGKVAEVQGTVVEAEVVEAVETNIEVDESMVKTVTNVVDPVVTEDGMVTVATVEEVMALSWDDLKAVAKALNIKIKGGKPGVQQAIVARYEEPARALASFREAEEETISRHVGIVSGEQRRKAEERRKEEEAAHEESVQQLLKELDLTANERALERFAVRTKDVVIEAKSVSKHENPALEGVRTQNKVLAENFLGRIGQHEVEVVGLEYFARPDSYGRIGKIHVLIPENMMEIKVWNREEGQFKWYEFKAFQLDQFRKRFMPPVGNGLLTLAIKENEKGLYVRLPKTRSKDGGTYYDVVRTKDIRFGKGHTDNNANLEAALSAFLRVVEGEYILQHPTNRFGFNESCMNCRFMTFMQVKDGVTDDLLEETSSTVLEQLDIQSLQYGHLQPQAYCTVYRTFVDQEAIEEANKAAQYEKDYYRDEDGELRWLAPNEVLIAGKAVKTADIRREGTASICASCPFYHKNEYKGEARIAAEKMKKREEGDIEPYVPAYYTTRAVAERMPVQTLSDGKWKTGFPGEFEAPDAFRVKGLGGVTVYGSDEIMAYANPHFVAPLEEVKWAELDINQKINRIFYAAFNLDKLSAEQADEIIEMAMEKPADLEEHYAKRWDTAVGWLVQSLEWAQDKERTKDAPPYAVVFFHDGAVAEKTIILSQDLLTNLEYREVTGTLPFSYNGHVMDPRSLPANEFIRHLDEETAIDIVYEALRGEQFFVEGEAHEAELVSESLQVLLQREINGLVYGVRRAVDQQEALMALGVSDDIKAYIKSRL